MLYKIHNPRPATQGIWVSGQRVMVRSGATIERALTQEDAQQAARRVSLEAIDQEPERIAHVEFLEVDPPEARGVIINEEFIKQIKAVAPPVDLNSLTDDQLRDLAKSRGIKVHHKAGRAKILEALL